MPRVAKAYVRYIDSMSQRVGKFIMYLVFVMLAILMFEAVSRTFFNSPRPWTVELSEFTLTAYYLLGGSYVLLIEGHVRMDFLYGRWSVKKKAIVDVMTFSILAFYLVLLLRGGIVSALYALSVGQISRTPWGPPLAPIKIVTVIAFILMLLQVVSSFFKDLATARGKAIT